MAAGPLASSPSIETTTLVETISPSNDLSISSGDSGSLFANIEQQPLVVAPAPETTPAPVGDPPAEATQGGAVVAETWMTAAAPIIELPAGVALPAAAFSFASDSGGSPNEIRGPPAAALMDAPAQNLTDIVLAADVYTNGDNKLFEGNVIIAAGRSITISTGPLGGNIFIEGNLNGTNDPDNFAESLTIIAGTGDLYIRGDIGNATPLQNLTIVSAGRVVINGNVQVAGQLRIINTSGSISLGVPLVEGGPVGNVIAGSVDISTDAEVTFFGALTTTGGAQSILLAARPVTGTGDITVNGNLTTDGPLTIPAARNIRFLNAVAVAGDLRQLAGSGTTTFDRQVAARSLDLTTDALVFNDRVAVAANADLILTADEIDFNGGPASVTSGGVDNSLIVLRPTQSTIPTKIGTAAGANIGVLDLSVNDLNAISDKFSVLIIGWEGSPDSPSALQRRAMTTVTAGGSTLASAWVEIRSPGVNNDLIFTANTPGAAMNGIVVRIFDDATVPLGSAVARYYPNQRLLTINVRLFSTPASAVLDAVNLHTKVEDTNDEYAAGDRPFTVTAGADYTNGLGNFETVISALTVLGANALPAHATLLVPGEDNDLLFTATAAGTGDNGATIVLLNRDVPAIAVNYHPGNKILAIQARLVDGPNGPAHTRAEIIAAVNAAGVPFTAAPAAADAGTGGLLELGRADLTNAAQFHAAAIRVINNVTAPQTILMSAWAGGILTPVAGVVGTAALTATATGPIQLNTNVNTVSATANANGGIVLGEADTLAVLGASAVSGSIYIVTALGDLTLASGPGVNAGGAGNIALLAAAGLFQQSDVQTAGGSISLQAVTGAITMAAATTATSNHGNVRYAAAGQLALTTINAGTGRISLLSSSGPIADANAAALNLTAAQIRLASGSLVGAPADPLEIMAGVVAGTASAGFFLSESDGLSIGAVSVTVEIVNSNLSTATQTDATLNGLTTQDGGHLVLASVLGSLTVDQPVVLGAAGNLRLAALAANQDISLNASLTTTNGHLTLLAGQDITQNTGGLISTGGGTVDLAAGGVILMQNGVTTTSDGATIRYQAAGQITLGGLNAGTGNVSVLSTGGAIVDGGGQHPEITAAQARLSALSNLGAGGDHLDLAVATLAATSLSAGVFITNSGPLTVDQAGPMSVNRVDTDGTVPLPLVQTDAALSDILAPAGPVVLIAQNGGLTINAGDDANGVIAAGNVLLQAQGAGQDLALNALARSNLAHVTLLAGRDILLNADGDVLAPSGDLLLQAQAGSVNMTDGAVLSAMGNIAVTAATDVRVGSMITVMNTISVVAGGAILDNGDADMDFQAAALRLSAGTGIGNGADLLDLNVQLAAATAGGGLFLSNSTALVIGAIPDVSVTMVQTDASQQVVPHAGALSGVSTTAVNGRLVVQTLDGTLTVNQPVSAHGSGNLLLLAQTTGAADKDLLLNASVASTSGRVSAVANRNVLQAATAPISTGGAGTVDVEAETGRIEMANGALTQTGGGTIRYAASGNILLAGLDAGAGDVSVLSTNGSIMDNGDAHVEIRAANARLSAGTAIGQSTNPLETQINGLAARAANGGIFLQEAGALTVTLVGPVNSYRVRAAGTSTLLTDAAMTGVTTTGGNGPIVLRTTDGSLTVLQTVTTHGSGNILLEAAGAVADLNLSAPVLTPTGNLTLLAAHDIWQQAAGDLSALGGTVDVEATTGSINMADGALAQTSGGHVRYIAASDITIGGLAAGTGTVSVVAGRAILDGGDSHTDIAAASARLLAGADIGLPADAVELSVNTLAAQAGGGIFLNEADDLIVGTVSGIQVQRVAPNATSALHPVAAPAALAGLATAGGDYSIILWTLNGSLVVNTPISASGQGNILLRTQSGVVNDKDLTLNAPVVSASGHISLVANRNITQAVAGTLATGGAGTISVEALNGSITMTDNGVLSATATTAGGNLRYKAAQNVILGGLNAGAGGISVQAVDGAITDGGDTVTDLTGNNIRLTAGTVIGVPANALDLSVNLVAARAAAGGIFLSESGEVIVGTVGQVAARRVQSDASATTDQDAASLAGLTTVANNGPVVLVAADSLTINQPVTAHGTGNILLRAGALSGTPDLALAAAVSTTAGNISLLAARHVNQLAAGNVATSGGTVDVQAFSGSITMTNGALTSSSGGAIRYTAAEDMALAGIQAAAGLASFTATAGAITDAGDTHLEITALQAQLVAGAGIGLSGNHLETSVSTLAATTLAGGLFLLNSGALTVDTVGAITVNRVDADGTTPVALRQTDAARSDLIIGGGAVVRTISGSITINDGAQPAGGSGVVVTAGNLLLQAQGTGADIQINAAAGVSRSISLIAARHVNQAAIGHITSATGTVDLMAQGGSLTMTDGARTETANANLRLWAAQNLVLSGVSAGTGIISATARDGSITDAGDSRADLAAAQARLAAGVGIGAGANHLETTLGTLAATATSGGIFITNAVNLVVDGVGPVTVNRVHTDGTLPADLRPVDSALSDVVTTSGNGSIVLRTVNGSLTINDGANPADSTGVRAHGTGNIRLETGTTDANNKNIVLNAAVRSTSGRITLLANASVTQAAAGDLITGAASIEAQAQQGAITMADGAVAQTTGATIRYQAQGDITLGSLNNGNGDVSILAGGSVLDGGDTDADVRSARLRVVAGHGIGTGASHLDTVITTLAARAGAGGLFLMDADALTVDALGVMTVSRVDTDGTTPLALRITDTALTEARTTGGGAIVLTALNGSLTLNQSVAADGAGHIRLVAYSNDLDEMDVLVNALVESGTGHITVFANRDVRQSVVGSITTGGGAISVDASTGNIIMENGALTASGGGNIRYFAAGEIRIGGLRADTGTVVISALGGRILDHGDTHKDVAASALFMIGVSGIGLATNPLDLSVTTLAARANGDIFLLEDDAITVDTVGPVTIQRVAPNGSTPLSSQSIITAFSDLMTTGGNGSIILQTLNGGITIRDGANPANGLGVSAHGSGKVLLEAQTTGANDKDIRLFAGVASATGSLSLLANQNLIQETGGFLRTGGLGTIEVEARQGNLTMFGNAVAQTAGGNIRYKAALDVTLTTLNAAGGDASVLATSGSILDGGDLEVEVIANRLRLAAGNGIGVLGVSANALETRVATLSARAEAGGINLTEADDLVIDDVAVSVNRVTANSSLVVMTDATQSDLVTQSGDGSIVLATLAGSITLSDGASPADNAAVRAHGLGNIRITTGGAASDLLAEASVMSGDGYITLLAGRHVNLAAGVQVSTGAGAILADAATGNLTMADTARFLSASGVIRLAAASDIVLGGVSTAGNVSLVAAAGSILDGGDTYVDIEAAGLRLVAGIGAGTLGINANALETTVSTVTARATSGGINLVESDHLTVGSVTVTYERVQPDASVLVLPAETQSDLRTTAGNGSIIVRTLNGTITLNDGTAPADSQAVSAHGSGNVLIHAAGASSDLLVNAHVTSTTGAVTLRAGRDLVLATDVRVTTQGPLSLSAGRDLVLLGRNRLDAGAGDIRIVAQGDATISGVATTGNVSIIAVTGSILDADDTLADVTANGLRLVAAVGIGTLGSSANPLEITVATLSARAGVGGISLLESDALVVDGVSVTVVEVREDDSYETITDALQSDLAASNNGPIVVRTVAGSLTLQDGQAPADNVAVSTGGNILLSAGGAGSALNLNADVRSGIPTAGGHVTLQARAVNVAANVTVLAGGTGTLNVVADDGNLTMQATSLLASGGGLRITASNHAILGLVAAPLANVAITATAGSITNAGVAAPLVNVAAQQLRLVAGVGVGVLGGSASPLRTAVSAVSARATSGGINLLEADAIAVDDTTVTVQVVQPDATVAALTEARQNDLQTTAGNGSIVLVTLSGGLTLNEGTPSNLQAVSAHGTGNVYLMAGGAGAAVTANSDVRSLNGHVTVQAVGSVTFNALADIITGGSGTIYVEAIGGSVTMSSNSQFFNGLGAIRVVASNNVVVGNLTTLNNVSVIAANGSILDGSASFAHNIFADGARLVAAGSIGTLGAGHDPLETTVATVATRAGAGGVNLTEADALTVGSVAVTVSRVRDDATVESVTDAALADVVTLANGSIRLFTAAGTLTLTDGGDGNGEAVRAAGTGNILLSAAGATSDVAASASVISSGGHATLLAGRHVTLGANVLLGTSGAGTINVEAATGSLTMNATSRIATVNGDVRVLAAQNAALGRIIAANAAVTATAGSVTDSGVAQVNVEARQLRLVAGIGIGTGASPLLTQVEQVSARATSGGIFLREYDAVSIADASATVQIVQDDATVQTHTVAVQHGVLTTTGNGHVVVRTVAGALTLAARQLNPAAPTVGAHGTGNLLLSAGGEASRIFLMENALAQSGTGHVTLVAGQGILMAANASVATTGAGTISLDAQSNDIQMERDAIVSAGSGAIRLAAHVSVVTGVVSTSGNVSIIALNGSITDAGVAVVNVVASQLRLAAQVGVGEITPAARPLKTTVATVSARASSGGLNLLESDALVVGDTAATVQIVQPNASVQALTDATQSDLITESGNGSILVRTQAGGLTLNDGTAGQAGVAANAHGSGHIALRAGGGSSDITAHASVSSTSGHVTVIAERSLLLNALVFLQTGQAGSLYVEAQSGSVTMNDTAQMRAVSGDIRAAAAQNIVLGGLATTTNISLAAGGSILDGGDTLMDLTAESLRLVAGGTIGTLGAGANALETTVAYLSARAAGDINILEADTLSVDDAFASVQRVETDGRLQAVQDASQSDVLTTANNGSIVIRTVAGSLSLNDGLVPNDLSVSAHGTGNILLQAGGAAYNVDIMADVRSAGGHVTIVGGRDVTFASSGDVATLGAGHIVVEATAGSVVMDNNAFLQTGSGAVRVSASMDVTLGGISTTGNVSLIAATGAIWDGGDSYRDVVGAGLRLLAGVGIGRLGPGADALDISVDTVTARATTGGINLSESVGLAVGTVAVTYQRVQLDATVAAHTDAAQSDVATTAGNGPVVLEVQAGELTLTDGSSPADGRAVVAHGSGNVLLRAEGALVASASVVSGSGHLTLLAARVAFNTGADLLTSASATIFVQALAGPLAMSDNTLFATGSGDVRLLAQQNLTVGGITTAGQVSLASQAGAILDAGDRYVEVAATGLRLSAATSVGVLGAAANALEISVNVLAAAAGGGGINLLETNSVMVNDAATLVYLVQSDASTVAVGEDTLSDLTSAGGSIVLRTLNGAITLNDGDESPDGASVAAGGNILIQAGGADVLVNAAISSAGGHVSVVGGRDVVFAPFAGVATSGAGTLNVEALNGSLTLDPRSALIAQSGDVRLMAAQDVRLTGIVTQGRVAVTAVSGSVLDGGDLSVDITAAGVRLQAGTGVGMLGGGADALETDAGTLSARAGAGGINVLESGAITVSSVGVQVQKVTTAGLLTPVAEAAQSDLVAVGGAIVLRTQAGSIRLSDGNAPLDGLAVRTIGAGNILLAAGGAGSDLEVQSSVISAGGGLTLIATRDLLVSGAAQIVNLNGTMDLEATAGNLQLAHGTLVQTSGGNIRLMAGGEALISQLDARTAADRATSALANQAAWGSVSISAQSSVREAGVLPAGAAAIYASALRLSAGEGVGGFLAPAPVTYRLQVTTNLFAWTDLMTVTSASGQFQYTDTPPASTAMRFYRVVSSDPSVSAAMVRPVVQPDGTVLLAWQRVDANGLQGALHVEAATLAAAAGANGLNVIEATGLTVNAVAVSVSRVNPNGTTSVTAALTASDLRSTGSGPIVLQTLAGNLVLEAGGGDNLAVAAAGAGNILLAAQGAGTDVLLNADVQSAGGHITIQAGRHLALAAQADVLTSGFGSVNLEAVAGNLSLSASSRVRSDAGNIRLFAEGEARVTGVRTLGQAAITAFNGAVLESGDLAADVIAASLRVSSGAHTGTAAAALDVQVSTLSVHAGGAIHVQQTGALTVSDAGIAVQQVLPTGATTIVAEQTQAGLVSTANNGNIVLRILQGGVTLEAGSASHGAAVSAHGSGNIRLDSAAELTANAHIQTATGHVTLLAHGNLVLGGTVRVQTGAAASLYLNSAGGSVRMAESSALLTNTGNIRVEAARNVVLGTVDARFAADRSASTLTTQAGWGSVAILAGGAILDAAPAAAGGVRVFASALHLAAGASVGAFDTHVYRVQYTSNFADWTTLATLSSDSPAMTYTDASPTGMRFYRILSQDGLEIPLASTILEGGAVQLDWQRPYGLNALEIETRVLAAAAGAPGLNLLEQTALAVDTVSVSVSQVLADGTATLLTGAPAADVTVAGAGALVLRTLNGSLTLNDGVNADGLAVSGAGNILLAAGGAEADVAINSVLRGGTGNISLLAGRDAILAAAAAIETGGTGTLDIFAQNGSVNLAAGSRVQTEGGNIRLRAQQSVTLGLVDARTAPDRAANTRTAQNAWGNISITALSGSIQEADAANAKVVDLYGNAARLTAAVAVGAQTPAANALETELVTIAISSGTGGLNVLDLTALSVGVVNTVPANRVGVDGTTSTVADAASLTGAVKTGGLATILSDQQLPIGNYPAFTVLNVVDLATIPNSHTGLYEQVVRLSNPTGSTIDSVRIYLLNLPANARVPYADGVENGVPYVQYNRPLAAGETRQVTIEYLVPARDDLPTNVVIYPVVTAPLPPVTLTGATSVNFGISRQGDNRYALAIDTQVGRNYFIQYSDDGSTWTTVQVPIIGTGGVVFWYDVGPSKTYPDPAGVEIRFYRVMRL